MFLRGKPFLATRIKRTKGGVGGRKGERKLKNLLTPPPDLYSMPAVGVPDPGVLPQHYQLQSETVESLRQVIEDQILRTDTTEALHRARNALLVDASLQQCLLPSSVTNDVLLSRGTFRQEVTGSPSSTSGYLLGSDLLSRLLARESSVENPIHVLPVLDAESLSISQKQAHTSAQSSHLGTRTKRP